jgi:hypothetical protein
MNIPHLVAPAHHYFNLNPLPSHYILHFLVSPFRFVAPILASSNITPPLVTLCGCHIWSIIVPTFHVSGTLSPLNPLPNHTSCHPLLFSVTCLLFPTCPCPCSDIYHTWSTMIPSHTSTNIYHVKGGKLTENLICKAQLFWRKKRKIYKT